MVAASCEMSGGGDGEQPVRNRCSWAMSKERSWCDTAVADDAPSLRQGRGWTDGTKVPSTPSVRSRVKFEALSLRDGRRVASEERCQTFVIASDGEGGGHIR